MAGRSKEAERENKALSAILRGEEVEKKVDSWIYTRSTEK